MIQRKHLLIVSHAPSENSRRLTDAVARGASAPEVEGVEVRVLRPFDACADHVLWSDAIILGTTENFGYMSGALKDFFDRVYYPCLEKTRGMPYATFVRAGNDGTGAQSSIERITSGLRWRRVQEPLICAGTFQQDFVPRCEELGMTVAAGLEAGLF
jgi:multimeric flavodoxin WrbA